MPVATQSLHRESTLQNHIVDRLVQGEGYELRNSRSDYDRTLAMDKETVLRFVQTAQPDEWERFRKQFSTSAEGEVLKQLDRNLKEHGLLSVMRNGIRILPGFNFKLCYFEPASSLNPERVREYEANILSVMKEVSYSTKSDNRIDLVLFVNGLPVATIEVKNRLTGTNFKHAESQYCKDRPPVGEPLLTFRRGAFVHFAMDEDHVSMTTCLANGQTHFLPFNRGSDGGAGNPAVEDDFPVAYLYSSGEWGEAAFSRSVLLDIIGRFLQFEKDGRRDKLIFPRFPQLDAVRKLGAHAREHGPGRNYLVQHSAGSGKTNTIAWLAHRAITLHDEHDRPVFNTAIVVTDRVVLDRSLQTTIGQFEQTTGVVRNIDGTSRQLGEALCTGARIIVTTIQKFSTDHLAEITGQRDRTFAVIVDEAHASQSGKSAQALAGALTRKAAAGGEAVSSDDIEDMIAESQKNRGPQENISFFAFTATPRNVTLERFGSEGPDGLPLAFHEYSMRQAIEEGFILDVLRNYMTYEAYYRLEKAIEDDPRLRGREGRRRVARFASLHPTALGQKIEIIVEHFRRHVMQAMDGQAKGMIVTQGREHALRYYFGIREYLERENYGDLRALVAFSGDIEYQGETYTEAGLNGFPETALPERFNGFLPDGTPYPDSYQILIVADKYQTGFDEPKLCAMYVDRKLAGLQAVQTLSRLNRTHVLKTETHILDFQNAVEDIQGAFRPYFESTTLEEVTELNRIYDLQGRLRAFDYLVDAEIENFARIFYAGLLTTRGRARIEGHVMAAVRQFQADEDEGRQEEFRQLLRSYTRFYAFVAQIVRLEDAGLEKLYSYASWLLRLLPGRHVPGDIEITEDMLRLQAFRLDVKAQGSAALARGEGEALAPIHEFGANPYTEDEHRELSEIVRAFNERHGTAFTEDDFIRYEPTYRETVDEEMITMLVNNAPDVVRDTFSKVFFQNAIQMFQRENEMNNIVLTDADSRERLIRFFFDRALREVKNTSSLV